MRKRINIMKCLLLHHLNIVESLTMLLHDKEELDYHFRGWPNHDLSLPTLLSIVHALESIIQNTDSHHLYQACKKNNWLHVFR